MQTLYLLCGLPFSGKTTLAKALVDHLRCEEISLDALNAQRGLACGDGIPIEEWELTHRMALQHLGQLMQSGRDLVLNDTFCFRWLRDRYRNFASQHQYTTVVIYLDVPFSQIQQRIQQNQAMPMRSGVKQAMIDAMARTFEPPQADETVLLFTPQVDIPTWLTKHFSLLYER